jgi:hypothetical protein
MRRKEPTWVERDNIYWRGERVFALADLDTWVIEIDTTQLSEKQQHYNEVHELVHLKRPKWREREVETLALFLHRALWKRGYRRK